MQKAEICAFILIYPRLTAWQDFLIF